MATSPIYSWPEPDNTDLVKNGALAIRTLGNAIDTTMATMVPKTIVDAKGDLIAGTAADTAARLAVGNNGETLVADNSTATGLRYQATQAAGRNAVINGGFDVWQRGTTGTFSNAVVYPAADRFYAVCTGTAPTCTMSQVTADTTGLRYGMRFGRNSGQTNTGSPYVGTIIETANSIQFAGKTVVFSFYAKAGANAPTSLTPLIYTGAGTDQSAASLFSTGWTSGANVYSTAITVTTTMTRYSVTATIPSGTTQIGLSFTYAPTGTAGANEWFQIEGEQFEIGSVATNFTRAGGTIQGELAACQRYYFRTTATSQAYTAFTGTGIASSTTGAFIPIVPPVTMRVFPTVIDASNLRLTDYVGAAAITGANIDGGSSPSLIVMYAGVASGLTQYRPYVVSANNNTAAYLGFGAEL